MAEAAGRHLHLERPVMLKEIAGRGVSAFLPQGRVYCGNQKLLVDNGIFISQDVEDVNGSIAVSENKLQLDS
mgnify:CR=1 FL=1